MNSPVLDALCLAHHPRWIQISDSCGWLRLICSNCGEPKTCRRKDIPMICPGCGEKMEDTASVCAKRLTEQRQ